MKKEMRRGIVLLVAMSGLAVLPRSTRAGVPHALTQQGRLFDENDKPITGKMDVTFAIYDKESAAGGDALWKETQSISFEDGWFSVALGATNPIGNEVLNGDSRFLGIKVNTDDEMSPRAAIRSVPYAFVSDNAIGDITPMSVSIPGAGKVIDENGKWVGDVAGLMGPQGPEGPPGPPEEGSFRGSFPIINEPFEVTNLNFTGVGPTGLDLAGAMSELPPVAPNRVRLVRFRTLYGDTLSGNLCNPYESEWRLARHDQPDQVFHQWNLPGTWASADLHHMVSSPYVPNAAIEHGGCDGSWDGGSCRIYARIPPACSGAKVFVKAITLEVYDFSQ